MVTVQALTKGFYSVGRQRFLCHNLVDLLRQLSRVFDDVRFDDFFLKLVFRFQNNNAELNTNFAFQAYEKLMKAFSDRNKVLYVMLNH